MDTPGVTQHACMKCGRYVPADATRCPSGSGDACGLNGVIFIQPVGTTAPQADPVAATPTWPLADVPPPAKSDPILDLINRAQESLSMQVAGTHYHRDGSTIQPIEFFHDNDIPFPEASAMKYLYRWRDKGGIQDLKKVIQIVWQIVAMEERKAARQAAR